MNILTKLSLRAVPVILLFVYGYWIFVSVSKDELTSTDDFLSDSEAPINPWKRGTPMVWYSDVSLDSNMFNPSIVALPSSAPFPFLGVAQKGYEEKELEGHKVNLTAIIACFMDIVMPGSIKEQLKCAIPPKILLFKAEKSNVIEKLENKRFRNNDMNRLIGPSDPKLLWDNKGNIMITYGLNSKVAERQRTVWLSDMRESYFELGSNIWKANGCEDRPLEIVQHELGLSIDPNSRSINSVEKNWAFMTTSHGFEIQKDVVPRRFYSIKDEQTVDVSSPLFVACFNRAFERPQAKVDRAIHQGTNMLRIVNCKYNQCVPSTGNTDYIQIIHVKNYITGTYQVRHGQTNLESYQKTETDLKRKMHFPKMGLTRIDANTLFTIIYALCLCSNISLKPPSKSLTCCSKYSFVFSKTLIFLSSFSIVSLSSFNKSSLECFRKHLPIDLYTLFS